MGHLLEAEGPWKSIRAVVAIDRFLWSNKDKVNTNTNTNTNTTNTVYITNTIYNTNTNTVYITNTIYITNTNTSSSIYNTNTSTIYITNTIYITLLILILIKVLQFLESFCIQSARPAVGRHRRVLRRKHSLLLRIQSLLYPLSYSTIIIRISSIWISIERSSIRSLVMFTICY